MDNSTYGNIDEIKSTHIQLNFAVDFDREEFKGYVGHSMQCLKTGTTKAIFDYVGMTIDTTNAEVCTQQGCYTPEVKLHTDLNPKLGNAVEVMLKSPCYEGDLMRIQLSYTTNNETTAINWLLPSQTAGKQLPYLFTQCESIACRSVAPMQDTPAIKITYEAEVKVESKYVVKMSANETAPCTNTTEGSKSYSTYHWRNDIKMPSYLIAIAVGDLEYRNLGNRVGVITEPSQMDFVANELADLQTLLDKTETFLTPYIWGNYSILILPPSFPFGGMENPLLTFASPTIITGDKS